jgi:SlyX protein
MIAMGELKTLSERVDLLETKLAFQDDTIETLNRTITEQWLKIDTLTRQLASLNARLQEAESRPPGPANEPPPHY